MSGYQVPDAAGMIKLDAMENPYHFPPELRARLGERLAAVAINRYPVPTYTALKAAICERLGVPAGFDVILGNGSDELITLLTVAAARPGASIVAPVPAFVMYELSARLASVRFVGVALAPDFSLDLPATLAAIERERPALVYLGYPNNPTGNLYDDAAIEAVVRAAPGAVVIDEAYQPFAQASWMSRLPEFGHLLVMRTVSKLGLAGIRLGYLAAAPAWLEQLEKLRPPYNVNVLTESAAMFALEHLDVLERQAAQLRADRDALAVRLAALGGVEVFASQANFVLIRVAGAAALWRALLERKVLVKDVGRMHPLLADCLRLTVGTPQENAAMVAALEQAMAAARRVHPIQVSDARKAP
ncbi:MAG: histidinol-phosphate transaminase [Burkholderiaceae bacterium]|nr:histidinol-phosphate transaminase [Burkholderiaceae bacterium]